MPLAIFGFPKQTERATPMINHLVTYRENDKEKQLVVPLPAFDIAAAMDAAYRQFGDGVEVIACKAQEA